MQASKNEIIASVCKHIEEKGDIGKCIFLSQSKLILEGGDGRDLKMFVPLDLDTIYS